MFSFFLLIFWLNPSLRKVVFSRHVKFCADPSEKNSDAFCDLLLVFSSVLATAKMLKLFSALSICLNRKNYKVGWNDSPTEVGNS